jgi:hypothetical protein
MTAQIRLPPTPNVTFAFAEWLVGVAPNTEVRKSENAANDSSQRNIQALITPHGTSFGQRRSNPDTQAQSWLRVVPVMRSAQ